MIDFASSELNSDGKEALVVRRGQDILASLILRKIYITSDLADRRVIMMTVVTHSRTSSPKIYLRFENDKGSSHLRVCSGLHAVAATGNHQSHPSGIVS
jgi:hypothetical protein